MSLRPARFSLAVLIVFVSGLDVLHCAVMVVNAKDLNNVGKVSSTEDDVKQNRDLKGNMAVFDLQESREGGSTGGHSGGGKRKSKRKQEKGMMEKMLPMMVLPFLVSTSMIPMMLVSLKFMILKSAVIGKIAILLMLLNLFRRRTNNQGGVFTHNLNNNDDVVMEHYGYHGDEEYGAYVNRR